MSTMVAVSLLALTMLTGAQSSSTTGQVTDAWLTMKTKIALLTADDVSAMDLNVDTKNGVVTLHGKVATEAEKTKAEATAKAIEGVKSVNNLLQVVPDAKREVVDASDDEIMKSVKQAFENDPVLSKSDITIASVNNGVVLLNGKADRLEMHLRAVETAVKVKGVRRVASQVTVPPRSS